MIWCVEDDSSIRDMEVYVLSSTGFEDGGSFLQINQHRRGNASGLQGKLEAHEYRNALKSGEFHEFAAFCE